MIKLHKLVVGKLDLLREGLTQCHGVFDHGLNLHWNIPLSIFHMCLHSSLSEVLIHMIWRFLLVRSCVKVM